MCACACVDARACLCPMSARMCAHSVKHTHTKPEKNTKNTGVSSSKAIQTSKQMQMYKSTKMQAKQMKGAVCSCTCAVIKNSNKLYIYKMLACRIHAFPSFKTRVNRTDLHAHFHNAAVTVCKRDGEGVWRCVCVCVCVRVCVCL